MSIVGESDLIAADEKFAQLKWNGPAGGYARNRTVGMTGPQIREACMKRQRGRSRRSSGGNNNPNRHYESNGPDVKIRGSAQQVLEKYLQYARDAHTSGDRVMSEAYFQHAEHYQRILADMQPRDKSRRDRDEDDDRQDDNDNTDQQDSQDESDQDRNSGRSRRSADSEHSPSDDPLKLIDGEGAGRETGGTDASPRKAADAENAEPRPKRRRTYRKRSGDGGAADGEAGVPEKRLTGDQDHPQSADAADGDGVMKTLSRGRTRTAPSGSPEQAESSETSEAAE